MLKRSFHVYDDSECEVELTIWGEQCNMEGLKKDCVILVNSGQINEFNSQKTINTSFSTKLTINPNVP